MHAGHGSGIGNQIWRVLLKTFQGFNHRLPLLGGPAVLFAAIVNLPYFRKGFQAMAR